MKKIVHDLVEAIFRHREPGGYADQVKLLSAQWQPKGWEARVVEIMAEASCRIRGCDYLEMDILTGKLQVRVARNEAGAAAGTALGDFECQKLLEQLPRYRKQLETDLAHSVRMLKRRVTKRKQAEELAAAKFAEMKPCTSVIQ